jgi:prepilin-type N-terminal cleavage/methylation domain-containing protein
VRAFFAPAPRSPHPASAARLLTSPAGRGKEAGFSLIELAIVLVILGLLAGGVLVGQSLIRAAELRSVVDDFEKYRLAVIIFEDRYRYLPGDMPNAAQIWGAADAGDGLGTDCHDATSNGTTTCNGNGNKLINSGNGSEWFHAWVQLKNAGLVEGSYTGRRIADPRQAVPGVNVPRSKLSNGGFTLISNRALDGDPWRYSGDYNPTLDFGAQWAGYGTNGNILKALLTSPLDQGHAVVSIASRYAIFHFRLTGNSNSGISLLHQLYSHSLQTLRLQTQLRASCLRVSATLISSLSQCSFGQIILFSFVYL